eukprot:scaffold186691_cov28-Tisochrysis_lutea.AAC.3
MQKAGTTRPLTGSRPGVSSVCFPMAPSSLHHRPCAQERTASSPPSARTASSGRSTKRASRLPRTTSRSAGRAARSTLRTQPCKMVWAAHGPPTLRLEPTARIAVGLGWRAH